MKEANQVIDVIAREIGLDPNEVEHRKKFLQFEARDISLLLQAREVLKDKEGLSDNFYHHLLDDPELRQFLPDQATINRLKQSLATYFDDLTSGDYNWDYIRDRLRLGVVHQRIGLQPQWYLGGYRKYLSELLPALWQRLQAQPKVFLRTCDALAKVVCLDVGVALDAYFHAERQKVLQHQLYLEEIIDGMPTGLAVVDASYAVLTINRMMRTMLGITTQQMPPMDRLMSSPALVAAMDHALESGVPRLNLSIAVAPDDVHRAGRHFEFNIRRIRHGKEHLLLLMAQDATVQLQARIKLEESEEYFRLTFSQAAVGIAHLHANGQISRANRKISDILGYAQQELTGLTIQQITHPDDGPDAGAPFSRLFSGTIREYSREMRFLHKKGHSVWVNVAVSSMRDATGKKSYVAVVEDISRRKQAEEELLHMANYDALTGLPNRLLLQDRLAQAILKSQRGKRPVAVLFMDLDRFKNVNDSLGHEAGDHLIAEIALRLARGVRDSDTVSRQGGDEFVIVLPDLGCPADADIAARKILAALAQPVLIQGEEIFPSASIGISIYPQDGADVKTLLKNADTAMYGAKADGGNCFQVYSEDMGMKALGHLKLEAALQRALEREEFVLHFQPQVAIRSGRIVGVEALLRWQPQGAAMVSPADFIPVAEETGLIVPIGKWVLAAACAQHLEWRKAGLPDLQISVNLSARQFQQQDLAQHIAQLLKKQGCSADWLSLEITESVVMHNPDAAAATLRELSDMGIRVAIDDFGTGYSSLSSLKRFPIHTLKIDHSFVRDITTDADDAMIVKSVIALAHNMKMSVVAEGVENAEQLTFLREHGCDQMQGYFFSKPVPAVQLDALVRRQAAAA